MLAEAIVTMQSAPAKTKILTLICDRLKPNGLFLSHELMVGGSETPAIRRDLADRIRVNATPLPAEETK